MKISLVMATAKGSYPLNVKKPHIFEIPLKSLENQTFTDFEFIIVDSLHEQRKDFFKKKKYSFPIKHVPPRPSIWFDRGMWALCAARNQGIIYSDGELVIPIDDGFGFGPNWLEIYWKHYIKDGLFAQSLHEYYNENGEKLVWEGKWVKDSRWKFIEDGSPHLTKKGNTYTHELGNWANGVGSSASMDALLKINGYDENFDGTKGIEDCDLGNRMVEKGCSFVFDINLRTFGYYIHYPWSHLTYNGPSYKSNYSLAQVNLNRPRPVANKDYLTEDEINFIREDSPKWDPDFSEDLFETWIEVQSIFDLREMREERIEAET